MLVHPQFDPVAVSLGPLQVHWYGLMYLIGFVGGWWLGRLRARPGSAWRPEELDDLVFYVAMGVILGGRVGYTLFYGLDAFLANPLSLFYIWQGGMSFHGGFLGVLLAMVLFGRKHHKGFWQVTDYLAPLVPIGLGAGRIGNFINQELWGKTSDLPWAMVFPLAGSEPRHPSMLYEALLEGPVLFLILWLYSTRPRPTMAVSALFLICYGLFRFSVEFVRLPDAHIGYLAFGWLTMGQVLSAPMIVIGVLLMLYAHRRQNASRQAQ